MTAAGTAVDGAVFTDAFIDGSWVVGDGPVVPVVDPATGAAFTGVSSTSVAQCVVAVGAAERARAGWAARPARERAEILRAAYELLTAEAEWFAALIVRENGKVLADARAEVAYAAEFFRWFAEEAVRVDGDFRRSPSGATWILVAHEPVGVALLVTPWNFPAAMATRKIAPALAAGCTVVLKPAMETPLTALALVDLLARAGVPDGVVNVVLPGDPGPAVAAMLADTRVRMLSFTGSTEVGAILLAEAAPNIVKCSMELGGNAPFLVFDDADLPTAIDGLMIAKMRNGGAACTAANRILVQRGIAADFVAGVAERFAALRVGSGADPRSDVGPLVSRRELERLQRELAIACAAGARSSGDAVELPAGGFFVAPTLLTSVEPDAAILDHEIFGPVAPVVEFDTVDDGVRLANRTRAGLVSYVFTRDLDRAIAVSQHLETGMVGLNRGLVSDPAAPFGGVKASGLGREGAHAGIHEFLETKYVAVPFTGAPR